MTILHFSAYSVIFIDPFLLNMRMIFANTCIFYIFKIRYLQYMEDTGRAKIR